MTEPTIIRHDSAETFVAEIRDELVLLAQQAIDQRGVFRISLSGGSTPKRLYESLVKTALDFSKVEWFWGDERNVPHEHPDSNYRMVKEALLDPARVPEKNVFPVPVDPQDPAAAATRYEVTLRERFGVSDGDKAFPQWDLVLLGLGDDAHTASLFPETRALDVGDRWFVENWVEKFSAYRYTLTAPAINSGRNVWFLVSGSNKRQAMQQLLGGECDPARIPASLIRPSRYYCTADALPEQPR